MTNKTGKPVLAVVKDAKKPKLSKKTGSGNGSGNGSGRSGSKRFGEYAIIGGAFHQIKSVRSGGDGQGVVELPLCDFTCKIIEEVTQDNGLEDQSILRIEGARQDGLSLPVADIPANKFYGSQANWANDTWGTRAFIFPGSQKKDNVRACIHLYSQLEGDVPRRLIYQYTGWKKINDEWLYLSGSGAMSAKGLSDNVQVDLGSGHMTRYRLPAPLSKEQLKPACNSVLNLLGICPNKPHIGSALLSAVARAPLGECHPTDFVIFIHGLTGSMKSSITAIPLAFFGEFNARRFPSNFSDTENDMEAKAFQAKDSIFVIDDFKPSVSQTEAARTHSKAERFVRNTGNQAGRGRRGSDMRAKPAPYNRSLALITGEDLFKGQSLLGRSLVLELTRSDVDTSILTQLQHAAEAQQLASLMSAYLQWLCPRMDNLKKEFSRIVTNLRNAAIRDGYAGSHPRAPEIYANLVAGAEIFMDFMVDTELLTSEQSNIILTGIEDHLKEAFSEQGAYQKEQDETERFLDLLRASFSSGNCYIACRLNQGPPPSRPHAWGWRSDTVDMAGEKILKPMGDCIGWYCDKNREVWLEKNSAFAVAQRLAKTQGDAFLLSPASLWRRMHEKGLIVATEAQESGMPKLTVKRVIGSRSKRVMILSADLVESE